MLTEAETARFIEAMCHDDLLNLLALLEHFNGDAFKKRIHNLALLRRKAGDMLSDQPRAGVNKRRLRDD